jgi:hypothetical protein
MGWVLDGRRGRRWKLQALPQAGESSMLLRRSCYAVQAALLLLLLLLLLL